VSVRGWFPSKDSYHPDIYVMLLHKVRQTDHWANYIEYPNEQTFTQCSKNHVDHRPELSC